MTYSKLSKTLPASEILAVAGRVRERLKGGDNLYNFTIGDFDPKIFPIPTLLEEDVITAYREHLTNYPQAEGNSDLREAISNYAHIFQQLRYSPQEIIVASGGRPLIFALYLALCDPGDKVIYPVPSWNNNYYTHLVYGEAVVIETREENHFLPISEEIAPHLAGATLLALCSPQNPTGTVYSREELKKICDLVVAENEQRSAGEKKLYVLYDQLYSQLVYEPAIHYNPIQVDPRMRPWLVTVDAISKSFAATGLRVGWAYGPCELIAKMKVLLTHMGAWAPMPEQKGLAAFLPRHGAIWAFLNNFRLDLRERLDLLYKGILRLKSKGYPIDAIAPEAAVFLSVKVGLPGGIDGAAFLLESCHLALIPFHAFGATRHPGWYRLSVGTTTPDNIKEMLQRLEEGLKRLHAKEVT